MRKNIRLIFQTAMLTNHGFMDVSKSLWSNSIGQEKNRFENYDDSDVKVNTITNDVRSFEDKVNKFEIDGIDRHHEHFENALNQQSLYNFHKRSPIRHPNNAFNPYLTKFILKENAYKRYKKYKENVITLKSISLDSGHNSKNYLSNEEKTKIFLKRSGHLEDLSEKGLTKHILFNKNDLNHNGYNKDKYKTDKDKNLKEHVSQEEIKIAKNNKIKQIEISNCEPRVMEDKLNAGYTQHKLPRSFSLKTRIKNQLSEFINIDNSQNRICKSNSNLFNSFLSSYIKTPASSFVSILSMIVIEMISIGVQSAFEISQSISPDQSFENQNLDLPLGKLDGIHH